MTNTLSDPRIRANQEQPAPLSVGEGLATSAIHPAKPVGSQDLLAQLQEPVPWETFPDIWTQGPETPHQWASVLQAASDVVNAAPGFCDAQRALFCPTVVQAILGNKSDVRLFGAHVSFPGWSTGEAHIVALVDGDLVDGCASKFSLPGCPVPKVIVASVDLQEDMGPSQVEVTLPSGAVISYQLTVPLEDLSRTIPFVQRVAELVFATLRRVLHMESEFREGLERRIACRKAYLSCLDRKRHECREQESWEGRSS